MATAQRMPKHRRSFAVGAAIALLVAWNTDSASASSPTPEIEAKATKPVKELDALSSIHVDTSKADDERRPLIHTRIPGVSDNDLARYKRQMFRTDI